MADAEMCFIVFDVLKELGFSIGDYCTRISNRKILSGLIQAVKLADNTIMGDIELIVFRAIDKLDRLGTECVRDLLTSGRKTKVETSPMEWVSIRNSNNQS